MHQLEAHAWRQAGGVWRGRPGRANRDCITRERARSSGLRGILGELAPSGRTQPSGSPFPLLVGPSRGGSRWARGVGGAAPRGRVAPAVGCGTLLRPPPPGASPRRLQLRACPERTEEEIASVETWRPLCGGPLGCSGRAEPASFSGHRCPDNKCFFYHPTPVSVCWHQPDLGCPPVTNSVSI